MSRSLASESTAGDGRGDSRVADSVGSPPGNWRESAAVVAATAVGGQRRSACGPRDVRSTRFAAALVGAAWVCATLVGGCGQAPQRPAVRVAINPWPGYAFLHLAERRGYFVAEGVDVKLVSMTSLADVRRAFERRLCDGFAGTLVEAQIASKQGGRDVEVAWICDVSDGADVLLAREGIASLSGLRGKKIGVEPNSLDAVAVHCALQSVGMRATDVELVAIPQAEMPQALRQSQVDAVQTYPPISVALLQQQRLQTLYSSSQGPPIIVDVLAFDPAFISRNPQCVTAILRGYRRAFEDFQRSPADAIALMAESVGMDEAAFADALRGVRLIAPDEQPSLAAEGNLLDRALRAVSTALRELGMTEGEGGDARLPRRALGNGPERPAAPGSGAAAAASGAPGQAESRVATSVEARG